jgi:hypothetical protein
MDELDIGDAQSLDSLNALAAAAGSDAVSGTEQLAGSLREALELCTRETRTEPRLESGRAESLTGENRQHSGRKRPGRNEERNQWIYEQ